MAKVPSRIVLRGGVYQYRRRVPDDVRALGGFQGREIFQISLRTGDVTEARARAVEQERSFERQCGLIRGAPSHQSSAINKEPAEGVVTLAYLKSMRDQYVASALADDIDEALRARFDPALAERIAERDDHLAPASAALPDGRVVSHTSSEESYFRGRIAGDLQWIASKVNAAPGTIEHRQIEATLMEAEAAVLEHRRARRPGSMFGSGFVAADAVGPRVRPEATWTLRTLSKKYLAAVPGGASWEHKVATAVSAFEQYLGRQLPISEINRRHIREFVELLSTAPQRIAQRFPGLSLVQAVEANQLRTKPFPTISPNTVRDHYFAVLRALFGYACGELDILPADPTERVRVRGAAKRSRRSTLFEMHELNALFAQPLFVGCQSAARTLVPGAFKVDDHQFWTPLLMLFSGIRPSEIAQLAVSDVRLNISHPNISILTEYDEADPGERPYVLAFKTENARRDVPLHPALLELGFAEYVNNHRRQGHERLFPLWTASADPRKLYSGATWIRRINEKVIPLISSRHPRPSIYSLRHTFKTQMAIDRVPVQIQDQVMGHARPGMDASYLKTMPMHVIWSAVSQVNYVGLDLDALQRRRDR